MSACNRSWRLKHLSRLMKPSVQPSDQGCLEAYVGAPGILQTLAGLAPKSPLLLREDEARTIAAIASAAQQGDPVAASVVIRTAVYLSAGLTNLINTINPDRVIMGSWVAKELGVRLLEEILSLMKRQTLELPFRAVQVVLSDMSRNPVSLGTATLVLEEYLAKNDRRPHTERQQPAVAKNGSEAEKTLSRAKPIRSRR